MFYNFVVTVHTQYRGYVKADSEEEAKDLIMSGDWDDAEEVGFVEVESIDDFEEEE